MQIESLQALRALYNAPGERALRKQLSSLDRHCLRFIELSPLVVLSSVGADGRVDASPRGGDPGFVKADGVAAVLLGDSPGNNRLDTCSNIIANGEVGLLFMIPGIDETLRVNGRAVLSIAPRDIALCTTEKRAPKLVIRVNVAEVYLHCAKAFMRSALWQPQARRDRAVLPSMGQMLKDQTGLQIEIETDEQMRARYQNDL